MSEHIWLIIQITTRLIFFDLKHSSEKGKGVVFTLHYSTTCSKRIMESFPPDNHCCFNSHYINTFVMSRLTVGCPAGVALCAVSRMGWGDGGNTGAPDKAKGCQTTRGQTTGAEAWGAQAWLAGFGKQRPGGHGLSLGCRWSRSMMGENLVICWKKCNRVMMYTVFPLNSTSPIKSYFSPSRLLPSLLLSTSVTSST